LNILYVTESHLVERLNKSILEDHIPQESDHTTLNQNGNVYGENNRHANKMKDSKQRRTSTQKGKNTSCEKLTRMTENSEIVNCTTPYVKERRLTRSSRNRKDESTVETSEIEIIHKHLENTTSTSNMPYSVNIFNLEKQPHAMEANCKRKSGTGDEVSLKRYSKDEANTVVNHGGVVQKQDNLKVNSVTSKPNKGGNFNCQKCNRVFKSRTGIYNHIKGVHNKRYSFQCNICDKTFLFKPHYIGHMNKHKQEKPFVCEKCDKSFRYKQTLKVHWKSCTGVKYDEQKNGGCTRRSRVLCDICGLDLSSKSALKQHHVYVHSDKPQQVCHDCGKCFKTEATLKRHLHVAHQDVKVKKYKCDTCGLQFKQAEVLRQHMKRHNKDFSIYCETCGML